MLTCSCRGVDGTAAVETACTGQSMRHGQHGAPQPHPRPAPGDEGTRPQETPLVRVHSGLARDAQTAQTSKRLSGRDGRAGADATVAAGPRGTRGGVCTQAPAGRGRMADKAHGCTHAGTSTDSSVPGAGATLAGHFSEDNETRSALAAEEARRRPQTPHCTRARCVVSASR